MSSSAFSFHCMICFEEFDTQTNYPVVLPCGHTYVCCECANRLDKCMECRTPLTMTVECPTGPQTPGASPAPVTPGAVPRSAAAALGGRSASPDTLKENQANRYADRVRNSPGFRRRYGHREEYKRGGGYYGSHQQPPPPPPPPPQLVKQRLPLPKNAVLLSLIQASEPARRRAEVEAPPTPQKKEDGGGAVSAAGSRTPPPPLPKYTRSSPPIFLEETSSGEGHDRGGGGVGAGSVPADEEHKIRVGTYLEGGPCGTYAVAAKNGLLVYPTLFEHTLPSALNGLRGREEEDVVKRDVEEMVKRHRARTIGVGGDSDAGRSTPEAATRKGPGDEAAASPVEAEAGGPRAWLEPQGDDGNVEARWPSTGGSPKTVFPSPLDNEGAKAKSSSGGGATKELLDTSGDTSMSEPGGAAIDTSDEVDDAAFSVSLTISDDESDAGGGGRGTIDASCRTLPARRSQSIAGAARLLPDHGLLQSTSQDEIVPASKRLVRHFSHGHDGIRGGADRGGKKDGVVDEFERPLIRLKHGDRVQVVSMDSRGWVKLARGYGYIRLENDKQLVKVGGSSDKACQIEAILHELSLERNRLKHEQMKLERLSAGLMIDLQSSLLVSEDHVIVSAPEGLFRRQKSVDQPDHAKAVDDLDVSNRTRTMLTPPRAQESSVNNLGIEHREIRTVKSHSPGRSPQMGSSTTASAMTRTAATATTAATPVSKAPPSPPYGQVTPGLPPTGWSSASTPTRVNFRTGLSGHRALTSSYSHPHDFIAGPAALRSMSNHAGISSSKKPSSRGRSIY